MRWLLPVALAAAVPALAGAESPVLDGLLQRAGEQARGFEQDFTVPPVRDVGTGGVALVTPLAHFVWMHGNRFDTSLARVPATANTAGTLVE
jgi:hypothetical protein